MGKNWAIAIGINHYDNLQPLQYARRDAESMRDFCLNEVGFEQVYTFTDDSPPIQAEHGPPIRSQPTFTTLSRFLRERFKQPFLNVGDNVWFFFAGHGKRHQDRDYLMPLDVDPGNIEGTAIPIHYVTERLRRCGADNVILMLDACRNEGDRDGVGIGLETQPGVVTLFACSPSERSYEIEALQQGAFTHALLQGLRIQGEGNCATVERLYQHLRYQVPALNRRYGKPSQTPYTIAEPATKLHLILLPKQATLQDVMALKNDALEAEAEREWEQAEQLWIRVLTVSPGDQQAIRAIKRIALLGVSITPPDIQLAIAQPAASRDGEVVVPAVSAKSELSTFEFEVVKVDAQEQVIERQTKQAQMMVEDLGDEITLEMVSIPGGRFLMGSLEDEVDRSNDESPQHEVNLTPFFMGKYPVTQAQWRFVAGLPQVNRKLKPDPSRFKGSDRPVEGVSWLDAVEFCDRLSRLTKREYRLPTEAEWEYACRAGTTPPFHFGATITTDLANYDGNYIYGQAPKGVYRQETTPVGSFKVANAFGLYDMHGNVWEWCLDHWHDNYQGSPTDGSAWVNKDADENAGRVIRGGSWSVFPRSCRSATRTSTSIRANPTTILVFGLSLLLRGLFRNPFSLLPSYPLILFGALRLEFFAFPDDPVPP